MIIYHCTTPKKYERYLVSKQILSPVRGWKWLNSAKDWGKRTGRNIILEIDCETVYPLPDHKPLYHSFWTPENITHWKIIER